MANVIAQNDQNGNYKITSLDNAFGGKYKDLATFEDGKVALGVAVQPHSKVLALAAADTAATVSPDVDVLFIDNTNTSSATVTLDSVVAPVGATLKLVCTGTGTVVLDGNYYSAAGGALTITGKGGAVFVYTPAGVWQLIASAA
jgi:hypothetical protein